MYPLSKPFIYFHVLSLLQALVFNSEKSTGLSEEIQGKLNINVNLLPTHCLPAATPTYTLFLLTDWSKAYVGLVSTWMVLPFLGITQLLLEVMLVGQ